MCISTSTFSQTKCDELEPLVSELLQSPNENSNRVFISDGQVYKAFVNNEEYAEFKVTLYGGSTYRIAGSTADQGALVFKLTDTESKRNELFNSKKYKNAPYWDFKVENTIDCIIEASLDLDVSLDGCMIMMIGFEKN
jgi:predicted methyltransferase